MKSVSGVIYEDFGFTLVNLNHIGHKSDRFVLASQAKKVFYVNDPSDSQWSVVLQTQTREWKIQDSELKDIPHEGEHSTRDKTMTKLTMTLFVSVKTVKEYGLITMRLEVLFC